MATDPIHTLVNGDCTGCDYSLNKVLEDTTVTKEEKVEQIKQVDTQQLKTEMEKTESTVIEQVQNLEKEILEDTESKLTVEADATASDAKIAEVFSEVKNESTPATDVIVGAALNVQKTDDPEQEEPAVVKLVISDPEETVVEDDTIVVEETQYDTTNGVVFSMTLEGVEDASNLEIPVRITLPVPANMDPAKLKVLHYHDDTVSVVEHALSEDGKSVSFVVTGFSDFAFAGIQCPALLRVQTGKIQQRGAEGNLCSTAALWFRGPGLFQIQY